MLRNKPSSIWKLLGVVLIVSLSGCITAYHDYPGCCIPYLYCPPPPLPYVRYEGCHCPTPGASIYFRQHGTPVPAALDSDVSIEATTLPEHGEPVAPSPR